VFGPSQKAQTRTQPKTEVTQCGIISSVMHHVDRIASPSASKL